MCFTYANATEYYVSYGGDNSDGLSWATAFTHPDSLNDYMVGGDTAYCGEGTWYGVVIHVPTNTTGSHTWYACSTGLSDTWLKPLWWSGTPVDGAPQIYDTTNGRNIYQMHHTYTGDGYNNASDSDEVDKIFNVVINNKTCWAQIDREFGDLGTGTDATWRAYHAMHNQDTDSIYAWFPNDMDSSEVAQMCADSLVLGSYHPVVMISGLNVNHARFTGIDMRMGKAGVINFTSGYLGTIGELNSNTGFIFEHCRIKHCSNDFGENPAGIFAHTKISGVDGEPPTDLGPDNSWADSVRIHHCEISDIKGSAMGGQVTANEHSGDGVHAYSGKNWTVDSCWIHDNGGNAVMWKNNDLMDDTSRVVNNIVKFCYSWNNNFALASYGHNATSCSTYGNIHGVSKVPDTTCVLSEGCPPNGGALPAYDNGLVWAMEGMYAPQNSRCKGDNYFGNNTLYRLTTGLRARYESEGTNYVMYNAFENRTGYHHYFNGGGLQWAYFQDEVGDNPEIDFVIDYNLWADSSESFQARWDGTNRTWGDWQTLGFDAHGDTLLGGDVLFDSASSETYAGFARTGASGEFDVNYGGVNWTIAGAIQPGIGTVVNPETFWDEIPATPAQSKRAIYKGTSYKGVNIK